MRIIIDFVQRILSLFGLTLTAKSWLTLNIPVVITLRRLNESRTSLIESLRPLDTGYPLVRIGGPNDGGYLIPNDFTGIKYCFSPGCGNSWNFEKDLLENYKIKSFILDLESSKPTNLESGIVFDIGWLSGRTSKQSISLESWIAKHFEVPPDQLILQMDIEHSEWECLKTIKRETLNQFRILIIEFHNFDLIRHARFYNTYMEPVLKKVLSSFEVAHVHGNNCCGLFTFLGYTLPKVVEITFHHKSRSKKPSSGSPQPKFRDIPHYLDYPNLTNKDEIFFSWDNKGDSL